MAFSISLNKSVKICTSEAKIPWKCDLSDWSRGRGFKSRLDPKFFFFFFFYIYLFYSMLYDIIKRSYKRLFFNFKENMISRGIFLVISCGEKGKASYLLIFSTDFIFFAQSSFSIPHKWQKDTFWALAHFLARFLSISALCEGRKQFWQCDNSNLRC